MAGAQSNSNGGELSKIRINQATEADIPRIMAFVDIHLRRDWLVRRPYLIQYVQKGSCYIALENEQLVAWAICDKGRLWNLLVRPSHRGRGLGALFLQQLKPDIIHSKSDQHTGDPVGFYTKHGYQIMNSKQGRKRNIDILIRKPRQNGGK